MNYNEYTKKLGEHLKSLDRVLGDLDYLQSNISIEMDALGELHGEVCERAEKIAQALDLNRKEPKDD